LLSMFVWEDFLGNLVTIMLERVVVCAQLVASRYVFVRVGKMALVGREVKQLTGPTLRGDSVFRMLVNRR